MNELSLNIKQTIHNSWFPSSLAYGKVPLLLTWYCKIAFRILLILRFYSLFHYFVVPGTIYKTTIVPSRTFCVVLNLLQTLLPNPMLKFSYIIFICACHSYGLTLATSFVFQVSFSQSEAKVCLPPHKIYLCWLSVVPFLQRWPKLKDNMDADFLILWSLIR